MTVERDNLRGLFASLRGTITGALTGSGFPSGPRGHDLFLAADFSGTHRGPLYTTYAFLLLDLDRNGWWLNAQRVFRYEALQGGRRFSFKALNDAARRLALLPFLLMADEIEGALIVVAVDKGHDSLFAPRSPDADLSLIAAWKPTVHEHLMRVTHLSALCVSVASKPNQNFFRGFATRTTSPRTTNRSSRSRGCSRTSGATSMCTRWANSDWQHALRQRVARPRGPCGDRRSRGWGDL